jgi:hypothetical protein
LYVSLIPTGDTFGALEDIFNEISGDDNDHAVPKLEASEFQGDWMKTGTHPSDGTGTSQFV